MSYIGAVFLVNIFLKIIPFQTTKHNDFFIEFDPKERFTNVMLNKMSNVMNF